MKPEDVTDEIRTTENKVKNFGYKLRIARTCRDINLLEVSTKTGCGMVALSEFERGHKFPSEHDLKLILDAIRASDSDRAIICGLWQEIAASVNAVGSSKLADIAKARGVRIRELEEEIECYEAMKEGFSIRLSDVEKERDKAIGLLRWLTQFSQVTSILEMYHGNDQPKRIKELTAKREGE